MNQNVKSLAARQFGPRAAAYVASAVHAAGADLDSLPGLLAGGPDGVALDLGCGGGHVSFTAAPHVGSVIAYDLSEEMLAAVGAEAARRGLANITTRQGPAETLPFADAHFDFVLSRYSAHHWLDLPAALAEVRRVLKPRGLAVFMDAVAPVNVQADTFLQTIEMLRDPSHVRDYTVAEWQAMARTAGFDSDVPTSHRIDLDYAPWIARMATPQMLAHAICALQATADDSVKAHFSIKPDGSFSLDTMTLVLRPV